MNKLVDENVALKKDVTEWGKQFEEVTNTAKNDVQRLECKKRNCVKGANAAFDDKSAKKRKKMEPECKYVLLNFPRSIFFHGSGKVLVTVFPLFSSSLH